MQNTNKYELIRFEDGEFSLDVSVSPNEETVWLNRLQIASLFGRDTKTISKHFQNKLDEEAKNSIAENFWDSSKRKKRCDYERQKKCKSSW